VVTVSELNNNKHFHLKIQELKKKIRHGQLCDFKLFSYHVTIRCREKFLGMGSGEGKGESKFLPEFLSSKQSTTSRRRIGGVEV